MRIKHIDYIRSVDPKFAEALDSIKQAVDNVSQKTKVDPLGNLISPPPAIGGISVLGANGVFDVVITDNGTIGKTINYFLEYSLNAGFTQPHVIDIGASRTWRGFLGNQTLFWRAYSQYAGSQSSPAVNFGAPTSVTGGGAAGPTIQPSTGSGTASGLGEQGGTGFGPVDTRTNVNQGI